MMGKAFDYEEQILKEMCPIHSNTRVANLIGAFTTLFVVLLCCFFAWAVFSAILFLISAAISSGWSFGDFVAFKITELIGW